MEARKTILIIDDEKDIVETLQEFLTDAGYHVITANNGIEGLKKISKIIPHLIILDMNMPQMGGIAFYKEILDPKTGKPAYPILVNTARANLEGLFKDFDIDGFMTKPFSMDELFQKISSIMEKRYGVPCAPPPKNILRKILVIEDEDEMFNRLSGTFKAHDYEVFRSTTGAEALGAVATLCPHLILLKLKLADTTGDVMALKLKMLPNVTETPIILYSQSKEGKDFSGAGRIYDKLGVKLLIGKSDPAEFLTLAELLLTPNLKAA
ncbi:MAG: response regulator [Candidatus Omnitrophica bacterium]|nr:response regulator [Candidatus Omnitrophota bacterium]